MTIRQLVQSHVVGTLIEAKNSVLRAIDRVTFKSRHWIEGRPSLSFIHRRSEPDFRSPPPVAEESEVSPESRVTLQSQVAPESQAALQSQIVEKSQVDAQPALDQADFEEDSALSEADIGEDPTLPEADVEEEDPTLLEADEETEEENNLDYLEREDRPRRGVRTTYDDLGMAMGREVLLHASGGSPDDDPMDVDFPPSTGRG